MRFIIVSGWRESGPGHWQSLWAERLDHAVRVQQDDWITPSRKAWVASPAGDAPVASRLQLPFYSSPTVFSSAYLETV